MKRTSKALTAFRLRIIRDATVRALTACTDLPQEVRVAIQHVLDAVIAAEAFVAAQRAEP